MRDGRKLSREALAIVRRKAVESVISGELTQTQAAAVFGIARATVCQWVAAFRRDGSAALTERPRGRRKEDNPQSAAEIGEWILRGGPEAHDLTGSLWNRELVAALLRRKKKRSGLALDRGTPVPTLGPDGLRAAGRARPLRRTARKLAAGNLSGPATAGDPGTSYALVSG